MKVDRTHTILISIHPKWVEKILSGEKTVEIRKKRPNTTMPFRCLIYETRAGGGCGMVVGEFTCAAVGTYKKEELLQGGRWPGVLDLACLTYEEIEHYAWNYEIFGLYICNAKSFREKVPLDRIVKANGDRYKHPPMSWGYCLGIEGQE